MAEVIENVKCVAQDKEEIAPSSLRQTIPLARLEPEKQVYRDRAVDAVRRFDKSRKTGRGRSHEGKRF